MKLSCPSCGAEVDFKSRSSVMAVCSYCGSTLVRHDMDLENLGKMAELAQDMSPLQIGTTGNYEGKNFEIAGRQKITWENGTWNEWYLVFANGKDGWLADAQGFYMISFQELEPVNLPAANLLKIDHPLTLKGIRYKVDDIKEVTCTGSEGELPVKSINGRKSVSVDLSGPENSCASIDFSPEGNRIFIGKYVEFEQLNLKNLREIDGW